VGDKARKSAHPYTAEMTLKACPELDLSNFTLLKFIGAMTNGSIPVKRASDVICASAIVFLLASAFTLQGFETVLRKHVSDRKTRPDVRRFECELLERWGDGEKDRKRLMGRKRIQKLRSKQSAKISDSAVNLALGSGGGLQESA
jgi:hypothetical protein